MKENEIGKTCSIYGSDENLRKEIVGRPKCPQLEDVKIDTLREDWLLWFQSASGL
jgi:hypothetical protein